MYDSRVGRWMGFDPELQFLNPYIGLGNDPIKYFDPTGGEIPPAGEDFENGTVHSDADGKWIFHDGVWKAHSEDAVKIGDIAAKSIIEEVNVTGFSDRTLQSLLDNINSPLSNSATAVSVIELSLNSAFEYANEANKLFPTNSRPVWITTTPYKSTGLYSGNNKVIYLGRYNGTQISGVHNSLKIANRVATPLAIIATGSDIVRDGQLTTGDVLQGLNTGAMIIFPAYGLIYGGVDLTVVLVTGGKSSLTGFIKNSVDDSIHGGIEGNRNNALNFK